MQDTTHLSGVIAPVLTPFAEDGGPDTDRFIEHCEWLLEDGCTALAPFGTTSEGPSLGLDERMELLEDMIEAGIDPARLMPGTGAPSLADAIVLTQHAVDLGCAGALVLPPYFFKQPDTEGLYRYYAELIEEVGDHRLRLYLYHIPQMTTVPITLELIDRLVSEYPDEIVGLKDSSGDMANTLRVIEAFPDLAVFPASESFLIEGMKHGAAGCISATANVQARAIRSLYDQADSEVAASLQARVAEVRAAIQKAPTIPGLKALIAHYRNDPQWLVVRPPLVAMEAAEQARLVDDLRREVDFSIPIAIETG